MALNITKATAYLKNQRKQFESQLSPEASVNYTSLLSEIRALERELSSPKYENQLQEYSRLRDSVRNELEHQKIEKEDLSDRLQKSRQVLDEFSFTDEASIEAYRNQAETLYQDYQHAQVSSSSKGSRFFQVFFFVAAAICAICAAYCGYLAFFPLPSPWLGAGPTASSLASPLLCFSCWESASHGTGAAAGRRRRKVPLFYRRFAPPLGRIRDFG